MKNNFYLIQREIQHYLEEFDVRATGFTGIVLSLLKAYKETESAQVVEHLIRRIFEWYTAWAPIDEFVILTASQVNMLTGWLSRFGMTIRSSYALAFQTNLFALLTPRFVAAFKVLCASTLPGASSEPSALPPQGNDTDYFGLWEQIEILGLLDRYEGVIANVGYEHIEEHIASTCTGEWTESVLDSLRAWLADKMFKWMVLMYARDAKNSCVRCLLHSLCHKLNGSRRRRREDNARQRWLSIRFPCGKDSVQSEVNMFIVIFQAVSLIRVLRTSEIFDIIIDFPDSTPAILDLKVSFSHFAVCIKKCLSCL